MKKILSKMKIFEKILLGFLAFVFILTSFYYIFLYGIIGLLDSLTITLLWGIPCLFIWVIVKIFIYFTKKKEKTEKVKKTENINKKIITLVLIFLIIINTIFWLNVTIRAFESRAKEREASEVKGRINWDEVIAKRTKQTWKDRKEQLDRALEKALKEMKKEKTITYKLVKIFWGRESTLITILIISDVVLVAIYFMIIPLYKKE